MKQKIILSLIILFLSTTYSYAEGNIGDNIIGPTLKGVARIVVATIDLEKVKDKLVNKLYAMDDAEFKKRYAKFYTIIKDVPDELKSEYHITPDMDKNEMIEDIKHATKEKIYKAIKLTPNKTVTALLKVYFSKIEKLK